MFVNQNELDLNKFLIFLSALYLKRHDISTADGLMQVSDSQLRTVYCNVEFFWGSSFSYNHEGYFLAITKHSEVFYSPNTQQYSKKYNFPLN